MCILLYKVPLEFSVRILDLFFLRKPIDQHQPDFCTLVGEEVVFTMLIFLLRTSE